MVWTLFICGEESVVFGAGWVDEPIETGYRIVREGVTTFARCRWQSKGVASCLVARSRKSQAELMYSAGTTIRGLQ